LFDHAAIIVGPGSSRSIGASSRRIPCAKPRRLGGLAHRREKPLEGVGHFICFVVIKPSALDGHFREIGPHAGKHALRSSVQPRTNLIRTSIGRQRFKPFRHNSRGVNEAEHDNRQNCWFRDRVKPHAGALEPSRFRKPVDLSGRRNEVECSDSTNRLTCSRRHHWTCSSPNQSTPAPCKFSVGRSAWVKEFSRGELCDISTHNPVGDIGINPVGATGFIRVRSALAAQIDYG